MEHFIVSARKYRPQTFNTVVGQAHITTTLKNAIKNKQLAHAFLFCGPRGVGKTTCARILAKTINCENMQADGEACNVCDSCVSFNDGASLNIHELDAASNNSVDDIRTLTEQVRFSPQAGKYKVYIIDEVHMLSASAFNAFLKTLEEPPPYAIFILATTEKHKILPTILSRCQIFDFKRITPNDTVEHLQEICDKEKITSDKAALQVISQKSEGCMRDALSILDKIVSFTNGELTYKNTLEHLNILDADYYFKLIEAMLSQDLAATLLLYDDINRKGFEGDLVLNGFAEFVRNLLVCRDEKIAGLIEVVDSFKERYVATAQKVSPAWLISALNILNEAEINYKGARNKKLHAELTLIKLTYLSQAVELVNEAGVIKKKATDAAKPVAFKSIRPAIAEPSPGSTASAIKKNRQATDAKLIIESSMVEEEATPYGRGTVQPLSGSGKPVTGTAAEASATTTPTLGALSKIRKQIARQQTQANNTALLLTMENLQEAWSGYIDKLAQQKNHSAVTNFKLAQLRVADNNSFEIVVESNIQQKFIEQERGTLIEHLQSFYNNRSLSYAIQVEEAAATGTPQERPLSSREQYLKMIEQYPMVKELKERLKLELDY
ncbi:DNA polymerase III subunit gamma/tau [Agriterribacter sp.]|uniref:DNA polymerase III subunit gamma/tau n=1 Tax=Agriterribacter sp. TaxID=2821509 RepID=UPI002C58142E|nr:DNA polymerase III subunit gamma/tau [Agriterribacter sp.]HRO46117.1 DNA polymerase III subunit gamma/tau [Agriterribacter sp.]HRQ16178.1 DNA polymerase III subunit gamma/tau [Agriterribacter sp.]